MYSCHMLMEHSQIVHILGYKINDVFKIINIIHSMFSFPNGVKLEINNGKISGKSSNMEIK